MGCDDMYDDKEMKPKMVSIEVSKIDKGGDEDPRLKVKKELLGQIRGMAMKAMKDQAMSPDEEVEELMDKGHKELSEEPKEDSDSDVNMLPENPADSRKDRLNDLMREMEELKDKIRQVLED